MSCQKKKFKLNEILKSCVKIAEIINEIYALCKYNKVMLNKTINKKMKRKEKKSMFCNYETFS